MILLKTLANNNFVLNYSLFTPKVWLVLHLKELQTCAPSGVRFFRNSTYRVPLLSVNSVFLQIPLDKNEEKLQELVRNIEDKKKRAASTAKKASF